MKKRNEETENQKDDLKPFNNIKPLTRKKVLESIKSIIEKLKNYK